MANKLPPIHPGEILLKEFLEPMGISQNRLARDIDVPVSRIAGIVKGARSGEAGKGQVGDGKIFVLPLENVIRISDGTQGGEAI